MSYYRNFDLTLYNSFNLTSTVEEIWFPEDVRELHNLLLDLKDVSFYILSYGTNVILAPTIKKIICLRKMPNAIFGKGQQLYCHANSLVQRVVKESLCNDWAGMEGLIGIPGSVGAAIMGNSGSGTYCISDSLYGIVTIDFEGHLHNYSKTQLDFKRRYCNLQNKKEIILWAVFQFITKGTNQTIIDRTLTYRKNFPKGWSAGGLFKNWYALKPYEKELRNIQSPNLYLSQQLNIVINKGEATYNEILHFIAKIRAIVKVPLELEVKIFK